MKDTESLGKKIKELRLKNNMSLRDLGEKSGVSYSFINSIEKNRFNGSRETIIAIASALNGSNKDELLLLAGFAPEDDGEIKSSRAYYGGGDDWTEEEKEMADAFIKTIREKHRAEKLKKQGD